MRVKAAPRALRRVAAIDAGGPAATGRRPCTSTTLFPWPTDWPPGD